MSQRLKQSMLMGFTDTMLCQSEGLATASSGGGDVAKVVQVNPLSNPIQVQVEKNLVEMKKAKFSFRTTEKVDELGQPVKDDKGAEVKWKRPTLEINVPLLTMAGLIAALQSGDKSAELALEQANDVIFQRVRGIIQELIESNPNVELTADSIDASKLGFLDIAILPRGERGAGISKEEWAAFVADYITTLQTPEAIAEFPDKKARTLDVLKTHGVLLAGKFNQVRSRKDVVEKINTFLDIWAVTSKNTDEFSAQYELLKSKAKAIMEGEDFNNL